jgi:integrase
MPRRSKGPRLWLRRAQYDKKGRLTHAAVWIIKDGKHRESAGCSTDDRGGAEAALTRYLNNKQLAQASTGVRPPASIPVADVLALYGRDVAPNHARPDETGQRIKALLSFFGDKVLSNINGALCRAYVEYRGTTGAARRELEDLRAAINHHRREGLCNAIVEVVIPQAAPARDRWLTREEAARLLRAAWRYREVQKGRETDRRSRQHVAKFILVALYTGTRASAVCGAGLGPTIGRGWIDLDRGVFYRRPAGKRETKKRQPPVPLPPQLLAHLRRWQRRGQHYAVEWNREPVQGIKKAFARAVRDADLGPDVTPHTLRHTAATWLMQAGTEPWEAAGFLGMSVETLMRVYGHHHPAYLSGARSAFSRHRNRHRNAATEREQSESNARKIADLSRKNG